MTSNILNVDIPMMMDFIVEKFGYLVVYLCNCQIKNFVLKMPDVEQVHMLVITKKFIVECNKNHR